MKTKIRIIIIAASLLLGTILVTGCQSDAQTGATLGALAGAGIGQIAGGDTESTLIGAAVGAGTGYFLGNEGDKKKEKAQIYTLQQEANSELVNVTNTNGSIVRVRLEKSGVGYVGPRGEYYSKLPTSEQLRVVYGF